jgi:hypothetical protein
VVVVLQEGRAGKMGGELATDKQRKTLIGHGKKRIKELESQPC